MDQEPKSEPESKDLELTPDSLMDGFESRIRQVLKEQSKPPPAESQDQQIKILEKLSSIEGQLSKSKPEAQDVAEHVKNCPECYGKVWNLFKDAKHECVGCGMPWIQDEATIAKDDYVCPSCKSDRYTTRTKK